MADVTAGAASRPGHRPHQTARTANRHDAAHRATEAAGMQALSEADEAAVQVIAELEDVPPPRPEAR